MSFEYSLDSMKSAVEYSAPTDLYTSIETLLDVIHSYDDIPFSCGGAFENTKAMIQMAYSGATSEDITDVEP